MPTLGRWPIRVCRQPVCRVRRLVRLTRSSSFLIVCSCLAVEEAYRRLWFGHQRLAATDSLSSSSDIADAIRATLELMDAPSDSVRERGAYNLAGISFTPAQIAAAIAERVAGFKLHCKPDFRQAIANSWPRSIDDQAARQDWGWRAHYDLDAMVQDMLDNLRPTRWP